MMFTVSRTPLPETGFEPLPRHKATEITMSESRQAAMSISSDLFPELLSWSAFIDMTQRTQSTSPPPQDMPNDIAEDDIFYDDDILTEPECHQALLLSQIFDPTTLAMGFDPSYLYGLDEKLIYFPQDAFLDLCWSDAAFLYSTELEDTAETSVPSLPSGSYLSSTESDSDPEECRTQEDTGVRVHDGSPTIKISSYDDKSPLFKAQVRDHMFNFNDYQFGQDGSVGAFPVPVTKPGKAPRRFNTFRLGRP